MWWFAAPVAIWGAKKLYDAVTEDDTSSSSSSYSNYDEQKNVAEKKARIEEEKKAKSKRKSQLVKALSDSTNNDLKTIKNDYLSSDTEFMLNSADTLKSFSQFQITDEVSALDALSIVSKNRVALRIRKVKINKRKRIDKEIKELTELELTLLNMLKKAT